MTWPGVVVLSCFGAALLTAIVVYCPLILALFGVVALVSFGINSGQDQRLATLAASRRGESICTFARSFDRRATDPWIIRAVFEELQPYCRFGRGVLPLRATDELGGLLGVDCEDLDWLVYDMAFRAGRSLDGYEHNPQCGRIETVADLVRFLMHQPKRSAA
ncbi:hypothetical protein TA3x_003696 [Tundrisphaera sp. TA3]|uniref:hypothetical protein n=1 Tax=Tundrisphaera sp. TA3 TaxID=3435775 RepID=UPI003EBDFA71